MDIHSPLDLDITTIESTSLLACGLVGLCVNVFLIYILLHFRKLYSVSNLFLINRLITDILRFIMTSSAFSVLKEPYRDTELLCFVTETGAIVQVATLLFETFMLFDWTMENFFWRYTGRWRGYRRAVICAVWTPIIFCSLYAVFACKFVFFNVWKLLSFFPEVALAIFVVAAHVARCVLVYHKRKGTAEKNYALGLVTLGAIFRLIQLLTVLIFMTIGFHLLLERLLPIAYVVYLYLRSEDFKVHFFKFFRCDLADDPSEGSMRNLRCQRCGDYIGFEDVSNEVPDEERHEDEDRIVP